MVLKLDDVNALVVIKHEKTSQKLNIGKEKRKKDKIMYDFCETTFQNWILFDNNFDCGVCEAD
ncbi:hypothetical protein [Mastigocoleus sp. MO_188.B34]|uniref:hypothetical protein n=1 Tax=Mastigocoleus sp. MO_188.B34 TaxID=3036635 RepID=UPI00261077FA|nr:hypothetical protein [Mastigocoleus sp. MO_188.B34]MDJ0696466.1 hypothetical protein [Mastigocoleus sp. MO_188.B34]